MFSMNLLNSVTNEFFTIGLSDAFLEVVNPNPTKGNF